MHSAGVLDLPCSAPISYDLGKLPLNPVPFIIILLLSFSALVITNYRRKIAIAKRWDRVCQRVAKERDELKHEVIHPIRGTGNNDETSQEEDSRDTEDVRIARLQGTEILQAIQKGKISTMRVVAAFSRRAHAIGNRKTTSVTQEFYDEAMEEARRVDAQKKEAEGKAHDVNGAAGRKILAGMPVSIKDSLHMKGALSTCGMACKAALGPRKEDGLVVKVLRTHGAIPFVRGNVPQCLMLPESDNAIWGCARNPWNLDRTPGGSSGGEASLVASRSTPIGIGSDSGGSLRIPAHFTGICALKPTPERMTKKGHASLSEDEKKGQQTIQMTVGPLANCVDDLELVMSAFCTSAMWDGDLKLPHLPWNKSVAQSGLGRPLKVGMFLTDHWFEPCAAVKRAVHEASEGLRGAGHTVVPFEPPASGWDIARLYYGQVGAEGNMKGFVEALQGEKMLQTYATLRRLASIPNWVRPVLTWVLENVLGEVRKAFLLRVTRNKGLSVRQYWPLVADTFHLRSQWETAMSRAGLDAVIFPPVPLPALPHGAARTLTPALTYTFLANVLHWPAGVVPVTLVQKDEEEYDIDLLPRNQRDQVAAFARKCLKGSAGLPVGVQVMSTPFKEELTLHVMREVERAVGFDAMPDAAKL